MPFAVFPEPSILCPVSLVLRLQPFTVCRLPYPPGPIIPINQIHRPATGTSIRHQASNIQNPSPVFIGQNSIAVHRMPCTDYPAFLSGTVFSPLYLKPYTPYLIPTGIQHRVSSIEYPGTD